MSHKHVRSVPRNLLMSFKLKSLLNSDPDQFLSALVNLVDTVHEKNAPGLTERIPQEEREAKIVDFITAHFP